MRRLEYRDFSAIAAIFGFLIPLSGSLYAQKSQDSARSNDNSNLIGPSAPVSPAVINRDPDGRATVRATRISEPPRIDGRLDEQLYTTITTIGGFIPQDPSEGAPATEKTEVWIMFDSKNLYIAARCHEAQPERTVANELRRDNITIFQNDNFGVILDTFKDRRNGFTIH